MKTVYTLTPHQSEELKTIQNKILYHANEAYDKVERLNENEDILNILNNIIMLSEQMEDILDSE